MGEVLAVRNEYRAQNWVQVIQECRASGLTNRAFCRQRGIPEKKFYYWLRKLRTQALEAAQPQIAPISPELSRRICSKSTSAALRCGFPGM